MCLKCFRADYNNNRIRRFRQNRDQTRNPTQGPSGRSTKGLEPGVWEILEKAIKDLNITNVAFGAHFYKYLTDSSIKTWIYPPESLSKNMILKNGKVIITPSSFNLTPIKILNFDEKI